MKQYMMLKIISGYDVIASIIEESKTTITVENPMLVIMTTSNSGSYLAYLKPYTILSRDKILTLQKAHVSAIYDPNSSLIEYYKKMIQFNEKFIEPDISYNIKTSIKVIESTLKMDKDEYKEFTEKFDQGYAEYDEEPEESDDSSLSSWDRSFTKNKKIH